ncbi:MAG: protein kinase, partial [Pseudolabrys sp.]
MTRYQVEKCSRAHDEPGSSLLMPDEPLQDMGAPTPQPRSQDAAAPAVGRDESPAAASAAATADLPSDARLGIEIAGRYRLEQKIGEGGMGEVWVARQTSPVKRKVALKLIKAGMDSTQVLRRFEAERQALALMDHPHIAKVLDAGTT